MDNKMDNKMEILSVTRTVAEYLRERIIMGEFKAGERLNELQITEKLGISRAPVREAFRILEKDHFVENIPRKGTFVARISEKGLDELFAAREMIEGYAIDLLREKDVNHIPRSDLGFAAKVGIPTPSHGDATTAFTYWKILSEFHCKLVILSENEWLIKFYKVLSRNLARYQIIYLGSAQNVEHSMAEHKEIEAAINAKEYDTAKRLLIDHIRKAHSRLKTEINGHF